MKPAPDRIYDTLKRYWGFTEFRPVQLEIIRSVLEGRDTLALMPTGGGKSLTYQVPTLAREGLCIVVTPLIALMKDQVDRLRARAVPAVAIHSGLSPRQIDIALDNCAYGDVKFLYVAPERLATEAFRLRVVRMNVQLIAVDEAHCISQWGYDFRPSYLRIAELREKLPGVPVLALTASATKTVADDIMRHLKFPEPHILRSSFARPNLSYSVRRTDDKNGQLLRLVRNVPGTGIVYVRTREGTEQIADLLRQEGTTAAAYHGGLGHAERSLRQEEWLSGKTRVMVATNAFGMGIDKSNVSYVIHYNMPKSVEAYYQEAGRAGRDGSPADCILLYSSGDVTTAKFLIFNSSAENEELTDEERQMVQAQDLARLEAMTGYCKTQDCLRGYLLDYFGQPHEKTCGNCGNCLAEYETRDLTREAQMILSCVVRARNRLGYCVGASILSQTLHGGRSARVRELGLDLLPTYGLMSALPGAQIREWIELLERAGYLETDPVHGGIDTTERAAAVLFSGEQVLARVQRTTLAGPRTQKKAAASRTDEPLLAALKALRFRIAQEQGVPAYIVFSNATLLDMAAKRPGSMQELLEVSGVGHVKAERYGAAFLNEISPPSPAAWFRTSRRLFAG